MKKMIGLIMGILLVMSTASLVYADTYGNVTLTVSVSGELSVSISPNTYDFGALAPGVKSVSSAVTINNDSTGYVQTYCLKGFDAGIWTLGATQGSNAYTLAAAFHGSAPASGNFGSEDLLKSSGWDDTVNGDFSTSTKFSVDGSQSGSSVNPGESRSLYFCLGMPTSTTTMGPLNITATITAILP